MSYIKHVLIVPAGEYPSFTSRRLCFLFLKMYLNAFQDDNIICVKLKTVITY